VFVFARALTYAALFIGFFLVYVPRTIIRDVGGDAPPAFGFAQRTFGPPYETYCRNVRRWWPRWRGATGA
jgi:hypothetical protein